MFGENNEVDKSFFADALSADGKIVIEVEAGHAVRNNQFLKDVFLACMMLEVEYLVIAVMNEYKFNFLGIRNISKSPLAVWREKSQVVSDTNHLISLFLLLSLKILPIVARFIIVVLIVYSRHDI